MKFNLLILFSLMMILSSCFFKPDVVYIDGLDRQDGAEVTEVTSSKADVSSFAIVNNQLIIDGTNLENVTNIRVTGPSNFDQVFTIESQTANNLVANGLQGIAFAVGAIFNLIITDVSGASTFPVTFTLQDGAVTASKMDNMGANIGQVLKYNGTTWVASDLSSLTFAGNWNANSNTPDLQVGGSIGEYYIINTAGTVDLLGGPGTNLWQIGDWVVWNDGENRWEKVDNATSVTSFNGRNGPVTSLANDYTWNQIDKATSSIGDIADVDVTGIAAEKVLKYDGTKWIIADYGGSTITPGSVTSAEISDGTITDADLAGSISQANITSLVSDLFAKLSLSGGTMTGNIDFSGAEMVDGVDVSVLKTQSDNNLSLIGTKATSPGVNCNGVLEKLEWNGTAFVCGVDADTDTNAGILCAAGEYLDGDGTCITVDATAVGLADVTNDAQMPLSYLDTDNTLAADSDAKVASQKAIKAYITANAGTGDFKADGSVAMTGDLDLGNNKALFKSDNANYVELIAPNALAATYTLTYPASTGSAGQLLSTNGSGVLSWVAAGGTGDFKADGTVAMTGNLTTLGLIDGVDVAALKTQSDTNVTNIAANVTAIATNVTDIATNVTNITALPSLGTTAGDALDISSVPNCTATQKLQMSAVAPFTFSCVTDYDTDINTNAETICTAGKYLDGDGSCVTVDATAVGLVNVTNVAQMPLSYLDTDNTLAADSDVKVVSQKAIKAYIAANTGTGDFKADGTVAMTGDLDFGNNKALFKSDNANYVELIAPNALAATYTLTYPASSGSAGQLLSTNGSGVLSWIPAGGTVTSIVAGTGLTGGTITTSGTINVDVGVGNNQVVQLNSSAQLPAIDGSLLTNLPTQSATGTASGDLTGSYPAPTLATSGVTAGTYTKITVDAKGRAITGASLVAADIPSLDAAKITSGTLSAARIPAGTDSTKLPLAGGTMIGAIAMGSSKITGLAAGTATDDAATKGQMESYVDASTDEMKTKTAGTYSRDNHSLEALRDELDTLKGKVDSIGTATGAHTWNVLSANTTLVVGNAYTFSITGSIGLTLPSLCTPGENIQITTTSSTSSGITIFANTSQKILYEGEQDAVTVARLMTLKLTCFTTDSRWAITEASGQGQIYAGDLVICGNSGNNCYDNTAATTALLAMTPSEKYLEYIDTGNGNFIWREKNGVKILKATGLDEWQFSLSSDGKSFATSYLTDISIIAGRACPDKVYLNDADKFSVDNCLYYDTITSSTSVAELGNWSPAKWYQGNISTCSNRGMRLSTVYETRSNDFVDGETNYPTSDGTPGFAGIGYDPTKGVPSGGWTWTATSHTGGADWYYLWAGTSDANTNNGNPYDVRCVIP